MVRLIATVLAGMLALAAAEAADAPNFQVGQKWTIKDSSVTIVIGRIEPFGDGLTAISVSVFDVPCPPALGCTTTAVQHAPFDSATLAASVDKLIDTHAPLAPGFEGGYATWKQAKGGVFIVPVSQLPELLFKTMDGNLPTKAN